MIQKRGKVMNQYPLVDKSRWDLKMKILRSVDFKVTVGSATQFIC